MNLRCWVYKINQIAFLERGGYIGFVDLKFHLTYSYVGIKLTFTLGLFRAC